MVGRATGVAASFAALTLAACGGEGAKTYSPEATAQCLVAAGAEVSKADADAVARRERGYQVRIAGKIVNIAFGESVEEADEIRAVYERTGVNEALYREGNAVLSWDEDPGPAWAAVDGCLRP
jgi:hypothetical protein